MSDTYDFKALEAKWRPYWRSIDLYRAGDEPGRRKHYLLDYFPYPSGEGLSVGHGRNYVPSCIAARFRRMRGDNVLHPMGWDAFGLPAENYAIRTGVHPRVTTARHSANYRRQLELLECSYDWSREINSSDPAFYRWTQWFFLLLYRRGLAYQAEGSQWWCPVDQTILANEQVIAGRCWRCGSQVSRRDLRQWYFRITAYADRLLADLDPIDWPEPIKAMQRNWIGRQEGVAFAFRLADGDGDIRVFTTRPDTLYGATFVVLAPEHPLVEQLTAPEQRPAVAAYVESATRVSEIDRVAADRPKTGVFTGAYALHPATGAAVPIWIADYVLPGYGSGAVMGVPAHDARDHAFALAHDLPIVPVVRPPDDASPAAACMVEPGVMFDSGPYSGLSSQEGGRRLAADLAAQGLAEETTVYKLRDWLISRQRYWGAPIPIVHCPACGAVPVPEADLPVVLPEVDDFAPSGDGRSPLARVESWVNVPCPQCGRPAQRETDTMDGFACSSWYFLRFASPDYDEGPFEPEAMRYWLPVDVYVGGAEHAVMHLLYARFWTKVMYDAGLVPFVEPFTALRNQGVLHAADGQRMSKSKGNVVTPDEVVAEHGTDALRLYLVFLGPFEGDVIWDGKNIKGVNRFLERLWRLARAIVALDEAAAGDPAAEAAFRRRQHRLIARLAGDYEQYKFNTAVAALMEHLNGLWDQWERGGVGAAAWREALDIFARLLAPMAPFMAEEIWREMLGHDDSVHRAGWPAHDEALAAAEEITVVVQVNGKRRDQVTVAAGTEDDALREAALARPGVQRHIDGKAIRRVVVVPGKLVNIVV